MKFQRVELHNHTNESDGHLTAEELVTYAEKANFQVMALTDHNIVSGQSKAEKVIQDKQLELLLLKGVEVTTSYGHILVLGLETMFDFTEVSPHYPQALFNKIKKAGGQLIGLAHPFTIGNPVMTGCRMYFEVEEFTDVDYIEIFNTVIGDSYQSNLFLGNYSAVDYWENLILSGEKLAAVSGKDLHDYPSNERVMVTYVLLEDDQEVTQEIIFNAIRKQRTIVTKGPLVHARFTGETTIKVTINQHNDYLNWQDEYTNYSPVIVIKDNQGNEIQEAITFQQDHFEFEVNKEADIIAIRIYDQEVKDEQLLVAGIQLSREGKGSRHA